MADALDELTTELGFDVDVEGLKDLKRAGMALGGSLGSLAAASQQVETSMAGMMGAIGQIDEMTKIARGLDMPANRLEQFADAMAQLGVIDRGMTINWLKTLARTAQQIARFGGTSPLQQFMTFVDDNGNPLSPEELAKRHADAIANNPRYKATIAAMGGLPAEMGGQALIGGRAALDEKLADAVRRNIGLTDERREDAEALADSQVRLASAFDQFRQEWKARFAPMLTRFFDNMERFLQFITPEEGGAVDRLMEDPSPLAEAMAGAAPGASAAGGGAMASAEAQFYSNAGRRFAEMIANVDFQAILERYAEIYAMRYGGHYAPRVGEVHVHGVEDPARVLDEVERATAPETIHNPVGR